MSLLNSLLKNLVVVDVECTTHNKGNPHTQKNKLVTVQVKVGANAVKNIELVTQVAAIATHVM